MLILPEGKRNNQVYKTFYFNLYCKFKHNFFSCGSSSKHKHKHDLHLLNFAQAIKKIYFETQKRSKTYLFLFPKAFKFPASSGISLGIEVLLLEVFFYSLLFLLLSLSLFPTFYRRVCENITLGPRVIFLFLSFELRIR